VVGEEAPDVLEGRPTELDGGDDRREVVVEQDQVGCLARDVTAAGSHGNPDIGLAKSGRVVDAVAGHGDDVTPLAESRGDPQLVRRGHARHDRATLPVQELGESVIVVRQAAAVHHDASVPQEAHLAGDRGRGPRVVAGDHRHPDVRVPAGPQRVSDIRSRRVPQPEQAEELEPGLDGIVRIARPRTASDRQDTPP